MSERDGDGDAEPPVLLRAEGVGKRFGGFVALQGVDITLRAGERLGLIGPNGSGKSTFVNCVSGDFAQHDGTVALDGQALDGLKPHRRARLGLARTFQLPQPFASLSVLENVRVPLLFSGDAAAGHRAAPWTAWSWSSWRARRASCRAS